jgi:RNA 3'-terminal phosphate cyclase (ATP)
VCHVDGSGGGGQILRTAVSCVALRGEAVRVEHVRGGRSTPGLKAQHRAAVRAVADACDAQTEGVHEGSETVVLDPGAVTGGDVRVDVGTAGAVTLVFDALLPLAARLDEPLTVTATGGTDVRWAPTIGYYERVKRPLLARTGVPFEVTCERRGFCPAGGGRATLRFAPASPTALDLSDRGPIEGVAVLAQASESLTDDRVPERACRGARRVIDVEREPGDGPRSDPEPSRPRAIPVETASSYGPADSPGASVLVVARYRDAVAGFVAIGERGMPAEAVGREAADAFLASHRGPGAVDEHALSTDD